MVSVAGVAMNERTRSRSKRIWPGAAVNATPSTVS